jgi:hypothetical protein
MKINADVALVLLMVLVIFALWIIGKISDARKQVIHMLEPEHPEDEKESGAVNTVRLMTDQEYRDEMFARNQSAREEAEQDDERR